MRNKYILVIAALVILFSTSCKKYLDVNKNPNAPQEVTANLYLGNILSQMSMSPQWDGRYLSKYSQMWAETTALNTYDRMGFISGSDANSEHWRTVYWLFGYNLINMMEQAEAEERWDILGVGYILKAWGWQQLTDLHSDIIITEAFNIERSKFKYDTQEFAYEEVQRLLLKAIEYLNRTDGKVSATYLAVGDPIYKGNRIKWKRFAYGLLAQSRSHLTNKTSLYKPDEIISYVDSAFVGNSDDALFPYTGTRAATTPFFAPGRNNFGTFRQTEFIVNLLDSTVYGAPDPRLGRMLAWSRDSTYQGLQPTYGYAGMELIKQPMNLMQYTSNPEATDPGKYIFHNTASIPLLTYSQLQFIKAEAAYYKGSKDVALQAYVSGIASHIEFVNKNTSEAGRAGVTTITNVERDEFLASEVVPADPDKLSLTHILGQKYIAQWGWAFVEAWTDLRRYHYTDLDPITGDQVFSTFTPPAPDRLDVDNRGELTYRVRPRYNSEYIWNVEELERIGGLERNYHTKIMWIFEKD